MRRSGGDKMEKLAVQLYTLREEMSKDLEGTLEKVAELGYKGVEFAGFFDRSADQLKGLLDRLELDVIGSHTPLESLVGDLKNVIEYNKKIGNKYIICPWAKVETLEDLQGLIDNLAKIAKEVKESGMELLYHNHDHEFVKLDGIYALDRIWAAFPNLEVKSELDTYWVHHAGLKASEYIRENLGRIALLHLKDGIGSVPCAIGEGDAPIQDVLDAARECGFEWIIVENDNPVPNGLDDITRSMRNIQSRYQ